METHTEPFDVEAVRQHFPILQRRINGNPLVYFDNAATAQRPRCVMDAVQHYFEYCNANVHRGVHTLAEEATSAFEDARSRMRKFLNAASNREVIFTRGVTEGVNLVAQAFARPRLNAGDEILITHMEHHSNIVPWQLVCEQTGAILKVLPINQRGELRLETLDELLSPRVKMFALGHVSNALGSINPVRDLIASARAREIPVLIDGAQAAPHLPIDVQALGCDFYCVSGHKMYGPTGIGVLYGRESVLDSMAPYHGGGEMIREVTFKKTTYNDLPAKFEAGTPNIVGAIGLGAAARFLSEIGREQIVDYENNLTNYALQAVSSIAGLRMIGTARHRLGVLSFLLNDVHAHDVGTLLDQKGIAIRTGHHCAMPVMDFFCVPATSRISLGLFNTCEEIDYFVESLAAVRKMFA